MANWWESSPNANPLDIALAQEGASGLLADLARSVYAQESGSGRNTKTSNAGAVGGMQVLPGTFKEVSDEGWDISDPVMNARAGVRYLNRMLEVGGGDPRLAAIGYYGGPGAIQAATKGQHRTDPRNPKAPTTFQYADQVMARLLPSANAQGNWWEQYEVAEPQQGNWWDALPLAEDAPPGRVEHHQSGNVAVTAYFDDDASKGGAGSGFLMGMRDPIDAGAQLLRRAVPESVGQAVDQFGNRLADLGLPVARSEGVEGVDAIVNQANAEYEAGKQDSGRDGFDWARLGGNIAGSLPILAAFPSLAAAGLPARAGVGAIQGGMLGGLAPVVGEEAQQDFSGEKAGQVALGSALGAATPAVLGGVSRVISPKSSRAGSMAKLLRDEGVQLTPGQTAGGVAMRIEDRAMSIPIIGDAIRSARGRANEQLNRAVYNRVLAPIGEATTKVGREAVDDVSNKVSRAYDDVLRHVQFEADGVFHAQLARLMGMARELPQKEADQFTKVIQREVAEPLAKGVRVDGQTFKRIESQLGKRASNYLAASDGYQRDLGNALLEVQKALRENLVRLNPMYADRLNSVNESFAQLVRLQNAANSIGAQEGVFTPQQLSRAIRQSDRTARKNAYSRGKATMQDLSDAAQSRMSAKIPDSGTTERLLAAGLAGGIGYMANPAIPAVLAAVAIPYLPGVVRGASSLVGSRPHSAQFMGEVLRKLPSGALGVLTQ